MLRLVGHCEIGALSVHACNMLGYTHIREGNPNLVPVALLTKSPASRKFSMLFSGVCNESAMSEAMCSQPIRKAIMFYSIWEDANAKLPTAQKSKQHLLARCTCDVVAISKLIQLGPLQIRAGVQCAHGIFLWTRVRHAKLQQDLNLTQWDQLIRQAHGTLEVYKVYGSRCRSMCARKPPGKARLGSTPDLSLQATTYLSKQGRCYSSRDSPSGHGLDGMDQGSSCLQRSNAHDPCRDQER
jgi:hypothetical protein